MAKDFRPVDRSSVMLLPPDLREWLPEGHLAWFVIEAVEQLDVTPLLKRSKLGRAGRAPYGPRMLLALLIYAYAVGQRSSRQVERLCETDVAFRVISAQQHPDHSTIARFRVGADAVVADLFAQVLRMCAKAGMGKVGVVAIDGTKIAANAAKSANRDADWFAEQAAKAVREHGETDAEEDALFGDARGDELAPEFRDPRTRAARIRQALEELKAEDEQAKQAVQRKREMNNKRYQEQRDARRDASSPGEVPATRSARHGRARAEERVARGEATLARMIAKQEDAIARHETERRSGPRPVPVAEHAGIRRQRERLEKARAAAGSGPEVPTRLAAKTCNLTDPESRLMAVQGGGFVQGYNVQLAVSDDQIVLAVHASKQRSDCDLLHPMVMLAEHAVHDMQIDGGSCDTIGTIVADAGYCSRSNITRPGPTRLIATGNRRTREPAPRRDPAMRAMDERLRDPANALIYARRAVTVEPVNAHLKDRTGLRRFARRGLQAAQAEATLAAMTLNLLKIHRARLA